MIVTIQLNIKQKNYLYTLKIEKKKGSINLKFNIQNLKFLISTFPPDNIIPILFP